MRFVVVMMVLGLAASMPMPETCDNSIVYFMKAIGKEVMGKMKIVMKQKFGGNCLAFNPPKKEDIEEMMDCGMKAGFALLPELEKKRFRSDIEDFHKFLEGVSRCQYENKGVKSNDGLTSTNYKNAMTEMLTKMAANNETRDVLMKHTFECANQETGSGKSIDRQRLDTCKCSIRKNLEYCEEEMKKDPGMLLKIASKMMTLLEEPKCIVSIPDSFFNEPLDNCSDEINRKWKESGMPDFFGDSFEDSKIEPNSVEAAFEFLKFYVKNNIIGGFECMTDHVGIYDRETGKLNMERNKEIMKTIYKWENIADREYINAAMDECMPKDFNKTADMISENLYLTEDEKKEVRSMKLIKTRMEFDKCFCPKLTDRCGLRTEYMKVVFPILNPQIAGDLSKDIRSRRLKEAANVIRKALMGNKSFSLVDMIEKFFA